MAPERSSVINIFNNPWKKYRPLKTVALYSSFLGLGFAASIIGPTLVSMEILLDTDTKSISSAFSGSALGYLVGSVICGFVYAPINKELLFTIALFGMSTATAFAPFSPHLFVFVAACSLQGFFMGIVDTAGQSYILKLWEGHRYKEPIMQASHCIWSIGSTCGPFVIRPFLVDIRRYAARDLHVNDTDVDIALLRPFQSSIYETVNGTDLMDEVTEFPWDQNSSYSAIEDDEDLRVRVGVVRLAYVILAAMIFVCSVCFITVYFLMKPSCQDRTRRQPKTEEEKLTFTKAYRRFRISLLVLMFFFYFVYLWIEGIPGSYLAAFVVKGLGWPNNYGALVTSTIWGAHGVGRLIGVPIATVVSPRSMLIVDLVLTTLGFLLLLFVPFFEYFVWIGIVLAGLGMGTIFASGILWLETYMEITGAASSVLLTASSLGGILSAPFTGFLFDEFGHMTFVYILCSSGVLAILIFVGADAFARRNSGQSTKSAKNGDVRNHDDGLRDAVELKPLNKTTERDPFA